MKHFVASFKTQWSQRPNETFWMSLLGWYNSFPIKSTTSKIWIAIQLLSLSAAFYFCSSFCVNQQKRRWSEKTPTIVNNAVGSMLFVRPRVSACVWMRVHKNIKMKTRGLSMIDLSLFEVNLWGSILEVNKVMWLWIHLFLNQLYKGQSFLFIPTWAAINLINTVWEAETDGQWERAFLSNSLISQHHYSRW